MKTAVVFIHGFTGGEDTWTNDAGISFREMLMLNPQLNMAFDFFEFDYFTKITDLQHSATVQKIVDLIRNVAFLPKVSGGIKKNQPISHLSLELATYLRFSLSEYSNLVLIAHSMGGLIAKDHILQYEVGNGPRPIGYLSIAVPHKGALSAQLLAPTSNINAKELVPLAVYSDELNNRWTQHKNELPQSLYMMAQHDQYVEKQSATPFTVTSLQRAVVPHDHSSICKPKTTEDMSYIVVCKFLNEIAYKLMMAQTEIAATTMTNPDYDKEIFVLKMIVSDIGPMGVEDAKDCFFLAEVISKAANRNDAEEMLLVQQKVLSIYKQKYNAFFGTMTPPNHVFAEIHSEITAQDSLALKSSVASLTFLHKKGLLHQLANKLNKTVIWSDATDYFEQIEKAM